LQKKNIAYHIYKSTIHTMGKMITGQSIKYEPRVLGFTGYHPTSFQRFAAASGHLQESKLTVLNQESKESGSKAPSTIETLQRTLANAPRQQVISNGITAAPLISGRASDFTGAERRGDVAEGQNIMAINTVRNASHIPQLF
jgi:hypothetical protein